MHREHKHTVPILETAGTLTLREPTHIDPHIDPHGVALELADHAAEKSGVADVAVERLLDDLNRPSRLRNVVPADFGNPPTPASYEAAHDEEDPERFDGMS